MVVCIRWLIERSSFVSASSFAFFCQLSFHFQVFAVSGAEFTADPKV